MRVRKPKPRKVQKFMEVWFNQQNDAIVLIYKCGCFEILLDDGRVKSGLCTWRSIKGLTVRETLQGRKREFIGEIKP